MDDDSTIKYYNANEIFLKDSYYYFDFNNCFNEKTSKKLWVIFEQYILV